ncbi:hemophore [Mycobacterium sp. IDR2000157661]|uniref:hemophore n=1 Tax=Mycobacterium sp. IDR2000157661 TaxID=2867005 RepID=UPI001EEA7852|nr:hemophore [Mycobacterium sp. IDR2000157661]ULE34588.1 hemophore [Mycobacterium sp. IDR2000157661]
MKTTCVAIRRGLFGVFAASAAGAGVVVALAVPSLPMTPSATAAPDPCAASEVAKTIGSVADSTGAYLEENPQTNQALTTISRQQGGPQSLAALKTYFDANPEVADEMQRLQQPLASLSGRCKLPLTLPQVMGLMQAAQQGGGLPASLPAGLPSAQNVGLPGAGSAVHSPAASSASPGAGTAPGAAIAGLP